MVDDGNVHERIYLIEELADVNKLIEEKEVCVDPVSGDGPKRTTRLRRA